MSDVILLFWLEKQYFLAQNAQIWEFELKFLKTNVRFEISTFEIGLLHSLRLESGYLLAQNAQIWGFGLQIFKNQCQIWNQHFWNKVHTKFC